MIRIAALRTLFAYSDWANSRVLEMASAVPADALDRDCRMGVGPLRTTLLHILAGEDVWRRRWCGRSETPWPDESERAALDEIRARYAAARTEREASIAGLRDEDLATTVVYRDSRGSLFSAPRGEMMLQMCVHSTLHRAQALNMIRRGGAPVRDIDYLDMVGHDGAPRSETAVGAGIDTASLATCFEYGDWAQHRVFSAATGLSAEQLDRPFEIGPGSLRATLLHVRDTEHWWTANWSDSAATFRSLAPKTAIRSLAADFESTAAKRNAFIAATADAGLSRVVIIRPPGDSNEYRFRLGDSMIQLFTHGVHHRAQCVNMLRRLGADPLELDYMVRIRRPA